jgi:prepilin-type N-terminal cleavage/methylation domain-containing protein
MYKKRQHQKGFTLLELLVVISIMAMIGAIGIFTFKAMGRKVRFEGAAKTIKDKLVLARTSAITKARRFAVRATLTENTREWKIVTVDSVDNIFGNDDDRMVDKKPYYLPKQVFLEDEQEIEFTPEGGISYATSNPITVTDNSEPREIWKITLTLYKAAGMAKMSDIQRINPEELSEGEGEGEGSEEPGSEENVLSGIGVEG